MTIVGNRARHRGRLRRLATAVGLAVGVFAAGAVFAASASAHVKVSGIDAVQGGSGVVTFRVPSESATASTTGLRISFPAATPFTSVDVQPKAGWHATVTKRPLAHPEKSEDGGPITEYVASVDYRADSKAAAIPPGEFDMFNLSVGPFPSAPSVSFGALQTYSDGSTVNWDERSANGAEPEHPAPTLQLAASASGGGAQPAASAPAQPQAGGSSGGGSSGGGSSGGGPAWTGITGLIAGIVALVISLAVLMANRSRGKPDPSA